MTRKQRRSVFILGIGAVLALALALILFALSGKVTYFYDPSEILLEQKVKVGQKIRLGGLVEKGSVLTENDGITLFKVSDTQKAIAVKYHGILPDLFREGQGVIVEGVLEANMVFNASTVLAKHDENYMPKEVADSLKKKGVWQGDE